MSVLRDSQVEAMSSWLLNTGRSTLTDSLSQSVGTSTADDQHEHTANGSTNTQHDHTAESQDYGKSQHEHTAESQHDHTAESQDYGKSQHEHTAESQHEHTAESQDYAKVDPWDSDPETTEYCRALAAGDPLAQAAMTVAVEVVTGDVMAGPTGSRACNCPCPSCPGGFCDRLIPHDVMHACGTCNRRWYEAKSVPDTVTDKEHKSSNDTDAEHIESEPPSFWFDNRTVIIDVDE